MTIRSEVFERDPYSFYKELREKGGVHYLEDEDVWLVVSYSLASEVLRQPAKFSSSPFAHLSPSLHGADPPDHTTMRRLLNPYFTPEKQHAQRDSVIRHTRKTLSRLKSGRVFDAVKDIAAPIPIAVASEWIGLEEDFARGLQPPMPDLKWKEVKRHLRNSGVLLDLERETTLTEAQLTEFAVFFVVASYGSSRDLLLLSLSLLVGRDDVIAQVAQDRDLLPVLVDEILRLEPSAHTVLRRATSDVVLEGKTIPAGSMVWVSIGAANRDPTVFPDPDELRLDRTSTRNLAFGIGPHFCLGSPLARMESETILGEMLPLFPRLRSAGPMDIRFWDDFPHGAPSSRQIRSWPLILDGPTARNRWQFWKT